jgi:hypothetical protein
MKCRELCSLFALIDFNNFHFCARRMFVDEFIINSIIRSLLNEYWILLLAFMVLEDFERKKKNNEFISLLCVCGTLESRNLISHVFLIICVAVQANPKKEEEDEAASA